MYYMWSTQKLSDKQVVLTCYFSFSLFDVIKQKNEKILSVVKQHPHDLGCTLHQKSIASKYCNISVLKVFKCHMQY